MNINSKFEISRRNHLIQTGDLWKRLVELGTTEKTPLNFDFNFSTKNRDSAEALKLALSNYQLEIISKGFIWKAYFISGSSGLISWSEDKLLDWVDYLIHVGKDTNCKFEGCDANAFSLMEKL